MGSLKDSALPAPRYRSGSSITTVSNLSLKEPHNGLIRSSGSSEVTMGVSDLACADLPFMRVSGDISRPALSRKDHDRIFVSINGRYVSAPLVTAAIRDGYDTLLPPGRFPVAFLTLTIDTSFVDINVHPTKKEVRLSKEKEIGDA